MAPATRPVAAMAISVAIVVLVAVIWLGFAAPAGIHPMFYFVLIFLGGGGLSLLFSGVVAVMAGSRVPTTPALDLQFFAGIRRGVLAMALCAIVMDGLGVLLMLAIAGGRGTGIPVDTAVSTVVFAAAAVTVACVVIASVVLRRVLPTG
ncbi:hypothetical protein GCM10017566_01680 [Amycolatopsis bartoniae]|uniref:Uncharacterized protein n=1 Tax=Amycolatopsis bartoniae TaxID=941986 RepID=A0A8H9INX4_9PSEU|nr:hypothetical protein GCM10017566_01680 [Amycolatopsis bartoniae]